MKKPVLSSIAKKEFYKALTTGDRKAISAIFSSEPSAVVSEVRTILFLAQEARIQSPESSQAKSLSVDAQVVTAGGRIDDWSACLEDGARPEGMTISGSDALVISDTEAYSTVVEFPANTGMDTATLLAVQKWVRSSSNDEWKLEVHQTIPWSPHTRAQGTLRCDCRGCVALTRSTERRTFGGLMG